MATKAEKAMAYEAGRHAFGDEYARLHGADACPFDPGTDERAEWLRGFSEALEDVPDRATLTKNLSDAMKAGDDVG